MINRVQIKAMAWLACVLLATAGCRSNAEQTSPTSAVAAVEKTGQLGINYEAIRSTLSDAVKSGTVDGASLLLVQNGKVLFKEARGNLSIEDPVKIASSTKPVATVGILILVDEGKLSLTDTIGSRLPEFRGTQVEHATLKQLLSHSAGIIGRYPDGRPSTGTLAEFSKKIATKGTLKSPGAFSYGGVSIDIACRMAEVAAGIPIEEHLRKRVWQPLGMSHASFDIAGTASADKLARGEGRYVSCGGGMKATLDDMANFYQMLLDGGIYNGKRILSENSYREMTRKQAINPKKQNDPYTVGEYGLGLYRDRVASDGSPLTISHGGAFGTMPWADLDTGLVGVFFTESKLRTVKSIIADIQKEVRHGETAQGSQPPAPTTSQNGQRDPEQTFKRISGGADVVSLSQFEDFINNHGRGDRLKNKPDKIKRVFKRLDANGDGVLTLEEFKELRQGRR